MTACHVVFALCVLLSAFRNCSIIADTIRRLNAMETNTSDCWGAAGKSLGEALKTTLIRRSMGTASGLEVRRSLVEFA